MISEGYTIWARQTNESDIFFYKSDKWFKIWFYIVNKVFYLEGKNFKRGEALITYEEIMKATRASKQQVKDCIHYLEKEHMIDSRQTTRGKIRKVVNYEYYQNPKNYETTQRPPSRPLADHLETPPIEKNVIKKEKKEEVESVYNSYKELINKDSKLTEKAVLKIKTRLKSFSLEDLLTCLKNFSSDEWWMENNSHRGIAWFFDSDDRIDSFRTLKPRPKQTINLGINLNSLNKKNDSNT